MSSELLMIKCCSKDYFKHVVRDSTEFKNLTIFHMLTLLVIMK